MGRKGGQKAAQRWKTDPEGQYAQGRREALAAANRRKKASGNTTRAQVLSIISQTYEQTGQLPTWQELMQEVGVSRRTVAYHVAALKKAGLHPEV
ncbi:ArsR/SmtB family transcription factor [Corynebacterium glutamicum]|uniref:ArsR/SmtB family transcription factor n=1 Tax=Corynebacterium glutamicum TaxID=1718 RepID=UPI0014655EF3|nr:helix-turn-helix transcriptional regulator [Corynebacterium glutamicum]GFK19403.1 hypothetical protein KbCgl_19750 [Corynebacterium glutamicum]